MTKDVESAVKPSSPGGADTSPKGAPKKRDLARGQSVRQVQQRYFVRSYNHETEAYMIAWFDEAGKSHELMARVPKTLQSANGIHQRLQGVLDGKDGRNVALASRMVIAEGGKSCTLLSVNPQMSKEEKIALSENGTYPWPASLQRAVEIDLDFALQDRAMQFHRKFTHPESPKEKIAAEKSVHESAVREFREQALAAGASAEDVNAYIDREMSAPRSYEQILAGRELAGQVRYDQRYDFGSQNGHVLNKSGPEKLSALHNFSLQRALHHACVSEMATVLEERERLLYAAKALESANPLIKVEERREMSLEAGRLISSQTQLGLQDLLHIQPANPKIDEIEWQKEDPENSMHDYIQRRAAENLGAAGSDADKLKAYIEKGAEVMQEELEVTRDVVAAEQHKALPSAKKVEERTKDSHAQHILHQGTKQVEDLLSEF